MIYNNNSNKDNFAFIRLFFSLAVVIAHSYTLSGREVTDWLSQLTNGEVFIGLFCFKCFFVISGYLIFKSLTLSKNIGNFLWKRFLRIYPALTVVLVLTVLYGQFIYEGDVPYLQNKEVFTYIPNNLLLFDMQYSIKGIFENNPYKSAINGSLWSLPYEIILYIFICVFFVLRKRLQVCTALLIVIFLLLYIVNIGNVPSMINYQFYKIMGVYLFDLATFFTAGAILAAVRFESFEKKQWWMLFGIALLISSFFFSAFKEFQYISIPLAIIPMGLSSTKYLRDTEKAIGDISYGVYIYSFPVQQTLMYYFKLDYVELMATSVPISLLFGYLSWHLIEKKVLKLKYVVRKPIAMVAQFK